MLDKNPAPRHAAIVVDARGLRCPWPVLRLAAAVRTAAVGADFDLLADDPATARELAAWLGERGWPAARVDAADGCTRFRVSAGRAP